jgi:hypothetical protein
MQAPGWQAGRSTLRLRSAGLSVRAMFAAYLLLIAAGLVVYFVIGLLGR